MSNPFQEASRYLLSLDSTDITHLSAAELIRNHYAYGKVRFQKFMKDLEGEKSTFYDLIKKNRVDFFQEVQFSTGSQKQKVLKDYSRNSSYLVRAENVI